MAQRCSPGSPCLGLSWITKARPSLKLAEAALQRRVETPGFLGGEGAVKRLQT